MDTRTELAAMKKGNRIFSEKEIQYLKAQRIARIATASVSSPKEESGSIQPDVVPVGFDIDGEYLYIGGMNILKTTKYKNILKNNKVAIVIDDLKSVDPWDPRGIRIYGTTDIVTRHVTLSSERIQETAPRPQADYIRIKPEKKSSWGIDEPVFVEGRFNVKKS